MEPVPCVGVCGLQVVRLRGFGVETNFVEVDS